MMLSERTITVSGMGTEITVRRSSSAFHPAERGTAYVVFGHDGPEMKPV